MTPQLPLLDLLLLLSSQPIVSGVASRTMISPFGWSAKILVAMAQIPRQIRSELYLCLPPLFCENRAPSSSHLCPTGGVLPNSLPSYTFAVHPDHGILIQRGVVWPFVA